jgi:uncharacterized phage protein (TIGR01671 family)
MRAIEFRLVDKNKNIVGYEKWYTGSIKEDGFETAKPCWLYSKDQEYWNPEIIKHRYKDQFTGLLDRNGVKIFEGDVCLQIILFSEEKYLEVNGTLNAFLVKIVYKNAAFGYEPIYPDLQHTDDKEWKTFYCDEEQEACTEYFRVVGNVYLNPELLEQKQ